MELSAADLVTTKRATENCKSRSYLSENGGPDRIPTLLILSVIAINSRLMLTKAFNGGESVASLEESD